MEKLKIFELRWNSQDEKEWVAAHTNIEALKYYCFETMTDLAEMEDEDEIIEIPESEWEKFTVRNNDYDKTDPEDRQEETFAEFMKDITAPTIIAGTMYD